MATEKDSELRLKPWFDNNRRKALYEWLLTFLADQPNSLRSLDDVEFALGDGEGMTFFNYPNDGPDGMVYAGYVFPVAVTSGTSTNLISAETGQHRTYVFTGDSNTFNISPEDSSIPAKITLINFTNDGVTVVPGLGVTVNFPVENGESLTSQGEWMTLTRTAANTWYAQSNQFTVGPTTDNTVLRAHGTNGRAQSSGVIIDDSNMLHGHKAATNAQTGVAYTLVASDTGKVITLSNASAITLTLENSLPVGFICTVIQKGAGQVTFSPEAGATLRNRSTHNKTAGQYAVTTLYVDENGTGTSAVFYLAGDTAA